MIDDPQVFIAYTWGAFKKHREDLLVRLDAPKEAVMPKLRTMIRDRFGLFARIFPAGEFPGRFLDRIPR